MKKTLNSTHQFNIYLAKELGFNSAVILYNLIYWLEKNEANGVNYHEDRYWTYNSISAYADLFIYLSERQIRYALDKLEEDNIIMTGNFNKVGFDKTKWYTLTDYGYAFIQNVQMGYTKCIKDVDEVYKPIPDVNTDVNTNELHIVKAEELPTKERIPYKEIIEYLNERVNKKYDFKTQSYRTSIKKLWDKEYTLENFKHVIDVKTEQWHNESWEFRGKPVSGNNLLNPHKLFGDNFDQYVNEERRINGKNSSTSRYNVPIL